MNNAPFILSSYPRAIVHIDGDCFFASCEMASNPKLKGKCIITGLERGIVSSMSYEAKSRGITRAMRLFEVKKICPDAVFLPSDYEKYSLFSIRMYNIVRRYTEQIEEYSIDECFAEITGLRRSLRLSYEGIAQKIKSTLEEELGITFSVGLAPTKVLSKLASKWKKPSGFTPILGRKIQLYLEKTAVGKIWGIGPQTCAYLKSLGVATALDYALKSEEWIKEKMTKPHREIWHELMGKSIYDLSLGRKDSYQSISKTKTFTPASNDREFVFSQLSKNIENACIKARRHKLAAKKIFFFLKNQQFKYHGLEFKLSSPASTPQNIIEIANKNFSSIFKKRNFYRSSGIVLMDLADEANKQMDLFGRFIKAEKLKELYCGLDELSEKYGKHTVYLGSSHQAITESAHKNERKTEAERKAIIFKGETKRRKIGMPFLGNVK